MSRPRLWLYFVLGCFAGVVLVVSQARATGGLSGLLAVGSDSDLRPFIEAEMPGVAVQQGRGHDGQIYYAIALDLTGDQVPDLLDNPGLRYRRILFPTVASVFGFIDGRALLWSEVVISVMGLGAASAAAVRIADQLGISRWILLGLLANPGLWLGVRLLTPDPLAFGLLLWGVSFTLESRHSLAIPLLAAGALAKEPFLAVAVGLAGWLWSRKERTISVAYVFAGSIPIGAWSIWLSASQGSESWNNGNLSLPFVGIAQGMSRWPQYYTRDQVYGYLTVAVLILAALAVWRARSPLITWLAMPWFFVAGISSRWIWSIGNGLMRNFAFVGFLGALAVGVIFNERGRAQRTAVTRKAPAGLITATEPTLRTKERPDR